MSLNLFDREVFAALSLLSASCFAVRILSRMVSASVALERYLASDSVSLPNPYPSHYFLQCADTWPGDRTFPLAVFLSSVSFLESMGKRSSSGPP